MNCLLTFGLYKNSYSQTWTFITEPSVTHFNITLFRLRTITYCPPQCSQLPIPVATLTNNRNETASHWFFVEIQNWTTWALKIERLQKFLRLGQFITFTSETLPLSITFRHGLYDSCTDFLFSPVPSIYIYNSFLGNNQQLMTLFRSSFYLFNNLSWLNNYY